MRPAYSTGLAPALGLYLLLVLTGAVYWPGLHGPWLFDDYPQLSSLLSLDPSNWRDLAAHHLASTSGPLHRPVAMLSFVADAVAHGGDVVAWKRANLGVHLITGCSLFWLIGLLADTASERKRLHAWWMGLGAAALWLLHPLQVSTVLYTVQRMAQLATLFTVLGLLSYVVGRRSQLEGNSHGALPIALSYLLFLPLAAFSKESGLLLPLLISVVELSVFKLRGTPRQRLAAGALLASSLLLPLIAALVVMPSSPVTYLANSYQSREFTLEQRVLTELRVLVHYLKWIVAPSLRSLGFFHDDIGLSSGLLSPPSTAGALVLLGSLLVAGLASWRRAPLVCAGISFFFTAHLLESTVIPLELVFEHRNYLASIGIFLAITALIARLPSPGAVAVMLLLSTAYGWLTVQRADLWADKGRLLTFMLQAHPRSETVATLVASQLTESGHYTAADHLLAQHRGPGIALNRLYIVCRAHGRVTGPQLAEAVDGAHGPVSMYELSGLYHLASLGLRGECQFSSAGFLTLVSNALARPSLGRANTQKLWLYKAHFLQKTGDQQAALTALESAARALRSNPVPLLLASEWSLGSGHRDTAMRYYERALRAAGKDQAIYAGLTEPLRRRLRIDVPTSGKGLNAPLPTAAHAPADGH